MISRSSLRHRHFSSLLLAALAGTVVLIAAGFFGAGGSAAGAYLWAWLFWLGPCAGSLVLLMIHGLTGGRWGDEMAAVLEPAAMAMPLMAILFIPVLLTAGLVYPWVDNPQAVSSPDVARLYLNLPGFGLRAISILVLWSALSAFFAWRPRSSPVAAGIGLLLYGLSISFAAIDWSMSVEPRFSSTVFGPAAAIAQVLAALAFAGVWRYRRASRDGAIADHSGLMLATLLGFAYVEYMQFLVIWAGGLPDKVAWYVLRAAGGWNYLMLASLVLGGALPFFLLLPSGLRRDPRMLMGTSTLVLAGLLLFWRWQMASLHPGQIFAVSDVAAPVALGALLFAWMEVFRDGRRGVGHA